MGTASGLAAAVSAAAGAAWLSLLWWRTETDRWIGHYCPDGYCAYADRLRAALLGGGPAARRELADFVATYLHAHNPVAPLLQAPLAGLTPHPLLAYMLVSTAASLFACLALRCLLIRAGVGSPWLLALLPAALATHVLVLRAFARPMTDALGMAATLAALWALDRERERPTAGRALLLFAAQLVGLSTRVSFIPVLGMPALAALAAPGPGAGRLRAAVRAALLFGLLPGAVFLAGHASLGTLHLDMVWAFAHREEFVRDHTWRRALTSLTVALQGYAVVLAAGASAAHWRSPAVRLHILWIALYLAFLGLGGGSLQPRYFLPIVPSVLLAAAPALAELEARRPWNARALVLGFVVANVLYVTPVSHDLRPAARLLGHDLAAGLAPPAVPVGLAPVPSRELTLTASERPDRLRLAADGDLETGWATAGSQVAGARVELDLGRVRTLGGLALWSTLDEYPRAYAVEASVDGESWRPVGGDRGRRGYGGFLLPVPGLVVPLPDVEARHLRVVLTGGHRARWAIQELVVYARPG
jgi:hypothetical protein